MGKGQRAREARAGKKEELKNQLLKQKRRSRIGKIIAACVAALIVLAIIAGFVVNAVAATGYFLRNTVVMSSDNFKVDNAMMTYFFKNEYYSFINQYSDYLSMYGLDTSKSLKKQTYGESTWFDYFKDTAKNRVNNMLLCAEKAKEDGLEISAENKEKMENDITAMKSYADQMGVTAGQFFASQFAEGINEADVRRALELSMLATEYQDKYMSELEYTDEDLQNYFDSNKSTFISADYVRYTFSETPASDADDAAKNALKATLKEKAEKLAANDNMDDFVAAVTELITEAEKKSMDEAKAQAEANGEEYTSETTLEQEVADQLESASGSMSYPKSDSEDKVAKWLFEDGRKVGDTYISEPADDAATYDYVVYCVSRTAYFDDFETANVRRILFTGEEDKVEETKKKAEEVLAKYNDGEKTEEAFIALAKENSADTSVEENGGLFENVTRDASSYPEEFINWCYDEKRQAGDVDIIVSDGNANIVYYVGKGEIAWKVEARNGKQTQDWSNNIATLSATHPVKTNESPINRIKA